MKPNSYFLLVILQLITLSCSSQKTYAPPPIQKLEIKPPTIGKAMEYRFPKIIESELNKALHDCGNMKNFIELSFSKDTVAMILYCLKNNPIDSTSHIDLLISSTNRYYEYKAQHVPVVFESDFRFSFPTFALTGSDFSARFVAKKWFEENPRLIYMEGKRE